MRLTFGVLSILLCLCCCLPSDSNKASGAVSSNKAGAQSTNIKDAAATVWVPGGGFPWARRCPAMVSVPDHLVKAKVKRSE